MVKFHKYQKLTFGSFVVAALIGLVPPWFVNFRAIDPKYSLLEAGLLLIAAGACLFLCRLADKETRRIKSQEADCEKDF